ncbi:MAG: 4Fe-4S dicluster domain-containing protein [Desulfobacteraceae bacterium]|nr:4Fe-4S dicluster domain-containing protein [Desulfobacteraceae bacterium]
MIKRPFFGIAKPKLTYDSIEDVRAEPVSVKPKQRVTLFIDVPFKRAGKALIKTGDSVIPGQRLQLLEGEPAGYTVSPVAGKISEISPFIGMMERQMTAVVIDVEQDGEEVAADPAFKEVSDKPTLEGAIRFLSTIPGKPDLSQFAESGKSVKTIVILGADRDLMTVTTQYVIKTGIASVKTGIDILRKITGVQNIVLTVAQSQVQAAGSAAAGVRSVANRYPAAHPEMILRNLLYEQIEQGGVCFLSAEAVAALGEAFNNGRIPLEKIITTVKKDGTRQLVSAPVGTHISEILDAVGEKIEPGDRLIAGGPMTGAALYSLEHPVEPDTDALIVQGADIIVEGKDSPCTNCGECVRICPVNVPVNELIRYMDAGEYELAAERAALFSCIECGLCAYVCESRIPIFQFIRLAKHAVKRMNAAEEANA